MPADKPVLHPESLAAQGMGRVALPYRDIVPPIYVSTTYERGTDGAFPGGRTYSRADNPTFDQAEALIAALEDAPAALLFSSGQAASGCFLPTSWMVSGGRKARRKSKWSAATIQ